MEGPAAAALAAGRRVSSRTPEAAPAGHLDTLDDGALAAAAAAGRREAFDEIVRRHRRAVYQICFRFAGNAADASDLTQDVFVRAWRGLGRFRGQAALSTWLYRIAVNVCLNRASVRRPVQEPLGEQPIVDRDADDPQDAVLRAERRTRVRAAIARLPPRQRATLLLRAYQDLSHEEIARILGGSVGASKANFFHALASLRRLLGERP